MRSFLPSALTHTHISLTFNTNSKNIAITTNLMDRVSYNLLQY